MNIKIADNNRKVRSDRNKTVAKNVCFSIFECIITPTNIFKNIYINGADNGTYVRVMG